MNIILGVYNGYNSLKTSKGGIYYFAKSLRKHNKDCKVVILCERGKLFKELEDLCNEYNFDIYSDFVFNYDLMLHRYEIYHQILEKWGSEKIDKIMLCDLDDVIFQGDPFSIQFDEQIYCAAECNILSDRNSGSSGLNRYWIEHASSVTEYNNNNFENQPVVCAGTILGTYSGIINCLQFYLGVQRRKSGSKDFFDQGLYNIYIYNYVDAHSRKILPHRNSQILTLDSVIFDSLNVRDNKIINDAGELYIVLHQINRCNPEFMKSLVD
jgi:hypothetical protein